jgi:UDP-3-O-[3-hydroxymyristoyl] glucosamine N-acyltransferase
MKRPPLQPFTLGELASVLAGRLLDPAHEEVRIERVRGLSESDERALSYIDDARAVPALAASSPCAALLVPASIEQCPRPAIAVRNPRLGFARALAMLHPRSRPAPGIHPTADVAATAEIDQTASVGPFCRVEADAVIGSGVVLHAHVHVGRRSRIGKDTEIRPRAFVGDRVAIGAACLVHAASVLGWTETDHGASEGEEVLQVGDDVEIGARASIEGGLPCTRIEAGTKTDNLIRIGASATVGPGCLLVSASQVGPRAILEHHVTVAGQGMVGPGVTIGAISIVGARGKVGNDLPPRTIVSGDPAVPHKEELRRVANANKLARLVGPLEALLDRMEGASPRPKPRP